MIGPRTGRSGLCWCETGEVKVLSTLSSSINTIDIVNIGTTQ
jgi:hypothetical protein